MTFLLVMTPRANGPRSAQIVIEHSAGATTADLDGDGYGGEVEGTKDRETYYACSSTTGRAPWPLALALLALRRRRR
jgi:MYXO-CTERM domain-containing protein